MALGTAAVYTLAMTVWMIIRDSARDPTWPANDMSAFDDGVVLPRNPSSPEGGSHGTVEPAGGLHGISGLRRRRTGQANNLRSKALASFGCCEAAYTRNRQKLS